MSSGRSQLSTARFFLDITPLLDEEWTGIPVVCANLARSLIALGCDLDFTLGARVVPRFAVHDALERHTGLFLQHEIDAEMLDLAPISWPSGTISVGLSASVKRVRRLFDIECSIIHDISTILQPHYHTPENIAWHAEVILEDIASNDITFCSSAATMADLQQYFGIHDSKVAVAHNAAEWPWWFPIRANGNLAPGLEPYVVILATREPRKNIAVVMDLLETRPDFLDRFRFVLLGRNGWLLDRTALPAALRGAVAKKRIVQAGFVSEYQKYLLLRGAAASLFPSFFEGFGLPVLEALSVKTPCVASFSSSIPEVGGDHVYYFDPYSRKSLEEALERALILKISGPEHDAHTITRWVDQFSWTKTAEVILAGVSRTITLNENLRPPSSEMPSISARDITGNYGAGLTLASKASTAAVTSSGSTLKS